MSSSWQNRGTRGGSAEGQRQARARGPGSVVRVRGQGSGGHTHCQRGYSLLASGASRARPPLRGNGGPGCDLRAQAHQGSPRPDPRPRRPHSPVPPALRGPPGRQGPPPRSLLGDLARPVGHQGRVSRGGGLGSDVGHWGGHGVRGEDLRSVRLGGSGRFRGQGSESGPLTHLLALESFRAFGTPTAGGPGRTAGTITAPGPWGAPDSWGALGETGQGQRSEPPKMAPFQGVPATPQFTPTVASTYPLPFLALVTPGPRLPVKAPVALATEGSMRDPLPRPPRGPSTEDPLGLEPAAAVTPRTPPPPPPP